MADKKIHHTIEKKTAGMTLKQKHEYLVAHKKKKEAKVRSNLGRAKKELFSRPSAK